MNLNAEPAERNAEPQTEARRRETAALSTGAAPRGHAGILREVLYDPQVRVRGSGVGYEGRTET